MTWRIGAFEIIELAGQGAAAEVWRGRHSTDGFPVAIKIPRASREHTEKHDRRFLSEVRAIARLQHPGIVQVLDYGRLDKRVSINELQSYNPGTPYLVMEWVDGGTLNDALDAIDWPSLRGTLLLVLDGLAAAHAQGFVHRDVKPENILLSDRGPVLADFGIAFLSEAPGLAGKGVSVVGTPTYMAPEQIRGDLAACGPPTDLYALGCLAYRAVTGQRPFKGDTYPLMARSHLRDPVPPLEPRFAVPAGLRLWIEKLLRKEPHRRYQLAADAALGLLNVGDDLNDVIQPKEAITGAEDTKDVERETLLGATLVTSPIFPMSPSPAHTQRPITNELPKMSDSWVPDRKGVPSKLPRGSGRSLFSWSAVNLVGRTSERDMLWHSLRECITEERLYCVGIFGEAGLGKSALAEWLCQRAHATGVALPMRIRHESSKGSLCGLRGLIHRYFRLGTVPPEEWMATLEPVCHRLGLSDYLDAFRVILEGQKTSNISVQERYEAVSQLCRSQTRVRPIVLVVDDLQWGMTALGLIEYLKSRWGHLPVLVICTVRSDLVPIQHPIARTFGRWIGEGWAQKCPLCPLNRAEQSNLIMNRLGLDKTTLNDVLDRAQGNPLFLEALVEHWIQDGALVPGGDGFRVQGAQRLGIPDSIQHVWSARLSALVIRDGTDWQSLEVAASLGTDVDSFEWARACRLLDLTLEPNVIDTLAEAGLVNLNPSSGWSFTHVLLRDFLTGYAHGQQRSHRWHLACAESIRELSPQSHERIGIHLLSGGHSQAAIQPLKDAISAYAVACDYSAMKRVLMFLFRSFRKSGIRILSREWQIGATRWQFVHRASGETMKSERQAALSVKRAERMDDQLSLCFATIEHAMCLWNLGERQDAIAQGRRACAVAYELRDVRLRMSTNVRLAQNLSSLNQYEEAVHLLKEAIQLGEEHPEEVQWYVEALHGMAKCKICTGDLEHARRLTKDIIKHLDLPITRWLKATCINIVGEIARQSGDFDQAAEFYREACLEYGRLGNFDHWVPEINLGSIHLARQEWQAADTAFVQSRATACRYQATAGILLSDLSRVVTQSRLRSWDTLDNLLGRLTVETSEVGDLEIGDCLVETAQFLVSEGMMKRADMVWDLASEQYRRCGSYDKMDEVNTQRTSPSKSG